MNIATLKTDTKQLSQPPSKDERRILAAIRIARLEAEYALRPHPRRHQVPMMGAIAFGNKGKAVITR